MHVEARWHFAGRARLIVAALALSLFASGCFEAPKRTAFDARTPLRDAMRERAERFMAGDLEGFLRYLSPLAREAEEPIGRAALAAELSSLEFVIAESEPNARGGLERVEIEWVYRYRGIPDDNVFRFRRLYRTEPQGEKVLIADSTDDPASIPPLWATGDVKIHRSEHFLALARPETSVDPALLTIAEDARATLLPKLQVEPLVPDDSHVLVVLPDFAGLNEYLRRETTEGTIAVARFELRPSGAENREMALSLADTLSSEPVTFEGKPDVSPIEVFRHELGHLALAKFTAETTPAWVVEGAAMYLSGERRENGWRDNVADDFRGLSIGRLRTATSLLGEEYPYANAAALYLIEQFGAPTFWQFYQGLLRTDVDTMLTRFYRTQDDRLDAQVQEWVRKQVSSRGP